MAQTPFGQVAGSRLTTDKLDRGDVLNLVSKAGWRKAPEVYIPPLTPADDSLIERLSQRLISLAPEPGCRRSVQYVDTNGDGDADHFIVGWICSF
tara:strand:+ start:40 stop:324 length:285 start_codon:yes stop_codon:yes gene_type:complete